MIERLHKEAGYSLVEVMVSILILTMAIIPMFAMFDVGLRSATLGGNYDRARAFAAGKLEETKRLPYEQLKARYPVSAAPTVLPATGSGLPQSSTCTVDTDYLRVSGERFVTDNSRDRGLMRVTVTVTWPQGSYTTMGLKAR
ncbi:Type IV minor pilin PilV [Rubrobacter xylanophilus DSM 9941]|uniref:type IV pilus modification PilV family protein n=1 Tax=Rubrobacter xylanophilus TaxID=49319 RepID=UPI001C63EC31|nr:prepilin-type N-terminal cleavage/methylation domain-containing protein [Rubrobacter xylanophilus]QYJ14401.1 Type IV minor pilin PilV [Rubrobacter xylanophilus DSM 9941]